MTQFSEHPYDQTVVPCAKNIEAETPLHWIEIELLGEDDAPIPWEEYLIELPSGRRLRGYLDEQGIGRAERLTESGTCRVCFPRLDQDAWSELSTSG